MGRIIPTLIQLQYPHDHILLRDATDAIWSVSNQRLPPTSASQVVWIVRRNMPLCLVRRRVNRCRWLRIHRYSPVCLQTAGLYEIRPSDATFHLDAYRRCNHINGLPPPTRRIREVRSVTFNRLWNSSLQTSAFAGPFCRTRSDFVHLHQWPMTGVLRGSSRPSAGIDRWQR